MISKSFAINPIRKPILGLQIGAGVIMAFSLALDTKILNDFVTMPFTVDQFNIAAVSIIIAAIVYIGIMVIIRDHVRPIRFIKLLSYKKKLELSFEERRIQDNNELVELHEALKKKAEQAGVKAVFILDLPNDKIIMRMKTEEDLAIALLADFQNFFKQ